MSRMWGTFQQIHMRVLQDACPDTFLMNGGLMAPMLDVCTFARTEDAEKLAEHLGIRLLCKGDYAIDKQHAVAFTTSTQVRKGKMQHIYLG